MQIFRKADESLVDETVTFVKVINAKLNRSCLWPLSKLKEKLVKMRKLVYAVSLDPNVTVEWNSKLHVFAIKYCISGLSNNVSIEIYI